MTRLDEAIQIIEALKSAINGGLCCDIEDFLGKDLYNQMTNFLNKPNKPEPYEDDYYLSGRI